MNRNSILSFVIVASGTGALLASTANSQLGAPKAYVNLQPTTPGTSQSGHANVSGTIRASQLVGGGVGVTNVNASLLGGILPSAFGQLSSANIWTGANTFGNAGNSFAGSGAWLTALSAANIASGTLANARTTGTSLNTANTLVLRDISGNFSAGTVSGSFSGTHSGDGLNLTNLSAAQLASGTLADARLSTNVALLNAPQTFGAAKTFSASPLFTAVGSPFSVNATGLVTNLNADLLDGLDSSAFLQSIPVPLVLGGTVASTGVVQASNSSTSGAGVFAWATAQTGSTAGVYGQSDSTDGRGVYGLASAASGPTFGGRFVSNSTDGRGVYGAAYANSGLTFGGRFESSSTDGRGVFGAAYANSGTTYGGYFVSDSSTGTGVYGNAMSYGVEGHSYAFGIGVYGHNYAGQFGSGDGVYGQSDGNNGRGVVGYVPSGSGLTYAVVGYCNSPSGYGTYSFGNSGGSGTKAFRIDHPFDPQNKYLLHYSSESPMPQNFYVGNVVTDSQGFAWIELPDYFSEINTNFKYQLTVIGKSFAQAIVYEEIVDGRFQIRTNEPKIKVSWRVDADRNDLYVRDRKPKDVVEKEGRERGTYQHPELYGMPKERGTNYRPEPEALPFKPKR